MALETWDSGDSYEQYVGRWSRRVAPEFLHWLALPRGLVWADIGRGTGALLSAILTICEPSAIHGVDVSNEFLAQARRYINDPRARFDNGSATSLPWNADAFDATVSGLVLNFVQDHESMAREMMRITKPGGLVAAYVWDYAGGMQMMRHFWDAAVAISPHDARLDQAERFPLCHPAPLQTLLENAGLRGVTVVAIDIPTVFESFDEYWAPFLGRVGAAPTYLSSVSDQVRERIRLELKARLAPAHDGRIALSARAWAVKGII